LNLCEKSAENMEYMIKKITEKLNMINISAVQPTHFNVNMYEDLKEIYDHVMKKNIFSPSEMQAIAEELGNLRKSTL